MVEIDKDTQYQLELTQNQSSLFSEKFYQIFPPFWICMQIESNSSAPSAAEFHFSFFSVLRRMVLCCKSNMTHIWKFRDEFIVFHWISLVVNLKDEQNHHQSGSRSSRCWTIDEHERRCALSKIEAIKIFQWWRHWRCEWNTQKKARSRCIEFFFLGCAFGNSEFVRANRQQTTKFFEFLHFNCSLVSIFFSALLCFHFDGSIVRSFELFASVIAIFLHHHPVQTAQTWHMAGRHFAEKKS